MNEISDKDRESLRTMILKGSSVKECVSFFDGSVPVQAVYSMRSALRKSGELKKGFADKSKKTKAPTVQNRMTDNLERAYAATCECIDDLRVRITGLENIRDSIKSMMDGSSPIVMQNKESEELPASLR